MTINIAETTSNDDLKSECGVSSFIFLKKLIFNPIANQADKIKLKQVTEMGFLVFSKKLYNFCICKCRCGLYDKMKSKFAFLKLS